MLFLYTTSLAIYAAVAELVDAYDSKSYVFGHEGSSPSRGTNALLSQGTNHIYQIVIGVISADRAWTLPKPPFSTHQSSLNE